MKEKLMTRKSKEARGRQKRARSTVPSGETLRALLTEFERTPEGEEVKVAIEAMKTSVVAGREATTLVQQGGYVRLAC
jgi:hypothetical protein